MAILSIHYGHDANITVIENGKCIFSIGEERLSRKKMDSSWPELSINYFKKNYSNVRITTVSIVGKTHIDETAGGSLLGLYKKFNYKNFFCIKIISQILNILDNLFFFLKIKKTLFKFILIQKIKKDFGKSIDIEFLDHHFCHVMGAKFFYELKNCLIFSSDGKGDGNSFTIYLKKEKKVDKIFSSDEITSLGFFYSAITEYLGFKRMQHEGKITGLAAYGNIEKIKNINFPIYFSNKKESLLNSLIKKNFFSNHYFYIFKFLFLNLKIFMNVFINQSSIKGRYTQELFLQFIKKNLSHLNREDISAYAQYNLEKIISEVVSYFSTKYKENHILLSGGTFSNVKVNQRIRELNNNISLNVLPGMSDAGLSFGGAFYSYSRKYSSNIVHENNDVYLGPGYKNEDILKEIKKFNFKFVFFENNIEVEIAKLLSQEFIVGRFNGRMEWGPRALGNRSVLADPRNKNINMILNKRLNRSEFMPFAPSVLDSEIDKYFFKSTKNDFSLFMTETYDAKNNDMVKQVKSVIHIDNTARPQLVTENYNSSFYKILKEFKILTGHGILVNTSFNLHEEPIVCSPYDALRALHLKAIDYLAIENYLVKI